MKSFFCFAILILASFSITSAQMAQWIMRPFYDTIYIPDGTEYLVSDSLGMSTSTWDADGHQISNTDGYVHEFHEGMSVITEKGSSRLRGYISSTGEYYNIRKYAFNVIDDCPFFSNGLLLAQEFSSSDNYYRFINRYGEISDKSFTKAYPFFNGYASCKFIENPNKKEYTTPCLIDTNFNHVQFSFLGNKFKESNVDFISSVNDDNIAIIIARNKAYLYFAEQGIMRPICATSNGDNLKDQAKINDYLIKFLSRDSDTSWTLTLFCRKKKTLKVSFDEFMRLKSVKYTDKEIVYYNNPVRHDKRNSPLRVVENGDLYGLTWNGVEILPPQFEKIPLCFADKAIVLKNGKYGMIQLSRDKRFKVSINKGKEIPFLHHKQSTNIKVDFPSSLQANKVAFDIDDSLGLVIDKTSVQYTNTPSGNFTQYDCIMNIPDTLFYIDTAQFEFSVEVEYDGFKSPKITDSVKVWLCKNLYVERNPKISINDGKASIDFSIGYSYPISIEDIYQLSVSVFPKSICDLHKFTETQYRCTLSSLHEGLNQIFIQVAELGMPPTKFPFDIEVAGKEVPNPENDANPKFDVEDITLIPKASEFVKKEKEEKKEKKEKKEKVKDEGGFVPVPRPGQKKE